MSHHVDGAGELIPCPFCGRSELEIRTDPIVGFPAVNCLECGAVGPNSRSHEKREAAANWNRKATRSIATPTGVAVGDTLRDARIQELEGERNIISALIKKTLSMLHPSVELPADLSMRDMVLQALALMRSSGVDSGWASATAGHLAARGSVPCPCTARGEPPSCEWCGGLGWLTERVRWARWREMERSERKSVRMARKLDECVRATLACWSEEERGAARELLARPSSREEGEGEGRAELTRDQAQRASVLAEVREALEAGLADIRNNVGVLPLRESVILDVDGIRPPDRSRSNACPHSVDCDRCEPCGLPVDGVAGGCTRPYGHNYECQVEREPNGSPPITPPPSFKELLHDALSTARSGGDPTISIEAAATKFMLACTRAEHQTAQASPPGAPPPSFRDRVHDACEEIERKLTGDASEEHAVSDSRQESK